MPPYCICLESKLNTVTQNKQISDISLMQPWLTVMKFLCVCLSGGGQGGSCSSLWLWTPHVSLWKHPVWKQQWTLFLPLKGNTHTHTHTHTHTKSLSNWSFTVSLCFPGGEFHGGQTMEQDICVDTTEGLHMCQWLCTRQLSGQLSLTTK